MGVFRFRFAVLVLAAALLLAGCETAPSEGREEAGRADQLERADRADRADRVQRERPQGTTPPKKDAESASSRKAASQSAARSNVHAMFKRLRVREPSGAKYSRDEFKHWADADGDGCDTRREVLRRQNLASGGGRCGAERGEWVSAYDGVVTDDPSSFDVDHLVPLAEAWRSGADEWPEARREAFANDLHPFSLIAVSAGSNRAKSDQDPSEWMPPEADFHCQYVARWVAVKFRWRLAVDRAERQAIADYLAGCDAQSLRLTLRVRRTKATAAAEPSQARPVKAAAKRPRKRLRLFSTCAEAKRHGFGPYRSGVDPEYHHYRDADGDGLVCE